MHHSWTKDGLLASICLLSFIVAFLASCRRVEYIPAVPETEANSMPVVDTQYLIPVSIGNLVSGHPWIAHVRAVDLDKDGMMDVVACEAQEGKILWLRQTTRGRFEEIAVAEHVPAPVHAEAVDINGDGHLDILVACMSVVFPDNDKIGSILILEKRWQTAFQTACGS